MEHSTLAPAGGYGVQAAKADLSSLALWKRSAGPTSPETATSLE